MACMPRIWLQNGLLTTFSHECKLREANLPEGGGRPGAVAIAWVTLSMYEKWDINNPDQSQPLYAESLCPLPCTGQPMAWSLALKPGNTGFVFSGSEMNFTETKGPLLPLMTSFFVESRLWMLTQQSI